MTTIRAGDAKVDQKITRIDNARGIALRALHALGESERRGEGTGIDQHLETILRQEASGRHGSLDPRSRALARELAFGATRRRRTLDYLLEPMVNQKLEDIVRNVLRLAVYQLYFLDRIPSHAAVDVAVEQVKQVRPRAAGLVNAVLRRMLREGWRPLPQGSNPAQLAVRHSFPDWLAERWVSRYGAKDAESLMAWMNHSPILSLRINLLQANVQAVEAELKEAGVRCAPGHYLEEALRVAQSDSLFELPVFREGRISVQDESSMIVAHVLDPQPGERVLDLASAPGGKTTHIQERANNEAEIIACDLVSHRLTKVQNNAERLKLGGIRYETIDGRDAPSRWQGWADKVLLDAPCSGTGVLHRRPDARWRKSPQSLAEMLPIQAQLLDAACACLKPGGVLVYSTCSLEPEENEQQVEALLKRNPRMRADFIRPYLPLPLLQLSEDELHHIDHGSRQDDPLRSWIQLMPAKHDVDGFFIARLRREG